MLRLGRLAVALAVIGCLDCSHEARQAPASTPATAHVPAHYMALAWFARSEAPLFAMLEQIPGGALPCMDDVLSRAEGYAQAEPLAGESSLLVFHGLFDRAGVERCIRDTLDKLALGGSRVTPDGAITELATPSGNQYLGWAADGSVIADRRRAAVEEALAGATNIADNAAVTAMLARVDRTRPQWLAGALDYTSGLLGVPSVGFFMAPIADATPPQADVTVAFRTADDARRAAAAFATAAHDARFSAALQQQIAALKPAVTGTDLVFDAAPIVTKPELFAEAAKLLATRTAETCDELRPMLVERERGEVEFLDWTKAAPAETKARGVDAAVEAILAACKQGSWPRDLLHCLASDPTRCDQWSAEGAQFGSAEEQALTSVFGPAR